MHYLDNAATTAPHPQVAAVIEQVLLHGWANPSSLYRAGADAEDAMETARETVARAMGAAYSPTQKTVFFTSGGTEGNNIAILGAARARKAWANHLVTTAYEHPSVLQPLRMLAQHEGFRLTEIAPGPDGTISIDAIVEAVGPKTALVCAMHVNNETGAVLDVAALAARVKEKNRRTFVHVDGVQAFCKVPLPLAKTQVDSYAVSGHKLHAPKGIGALYLKGGSHTGFLPPIGGGGQEDNIRPGTENTAYIAGFAKAVSLAQAGHAEAMRTIEHLHMLLLQGLAEIDGVHLHSPQNAYKGTVMFSMPKGLKSQVMLNRLDADFNVCVSSGSACSGGAPSHTLAAMGVPHALADSALRVSFDAYNTEEDIAALLQGLRSCAATLARVSR